MRVLLRWLGVALALAGGAWAGPGGETFAIAAAVWILASGLVLLSSRGAGPTGDRRWTVVVLLIAAVHGASATADPPAAPDPDRGLVELEIVGASRPGPRCEVETRDRNGRIRVLGLPPEPCAWASGGRIAVASSDLDAEVGFELPGEPRRATEIEHVFVRPGGQSSTYWDGVARLRSRLWATAHGDAGRGFVVAAVFGVRSALDPAHRVRLRAAGLGHLVAVSGLNVAAAGWLLQGVVIRIAARLNASIAFAVVLGWIPIVAYVGLCGAEPPAVRAAAMLIYAGVGTILGRPTHGPTALAVACGLMLAIDPGLAIDASFQLTVAAMAALLTAPPGTGAIAHGFRISWCVAPVCLLHFGDASLYGTIANPIAVPVFSLWILPLAFAGLFAMPWLGGDALAPAAWGAAVCLDLARELALLPPLPVGLVGGAAGLALGLRAIGLRRGLPPALPCAGILILVVVGSSPRVHEPGTWIVGGRAPAAVITSVEPGTACVAAPGLGPGPVAELLRLGGIERVTLAGALDDPRRSWLADGLVRAGVIVDELRTCDAEASPEARAALARCRQLDRRARALSWIPAADAPPKCWRGDGFVDAE